MNIIPCVKPKGYLLKSNTVRAFSHYMYENLSKEALVKILNERDQTPQYISSPSEASVSLGVAVFLPIYVREQVVDFRLTFFNSIFQDILATTLAIDHTHKASTLPHLFQESWYDVLSKVINSNHFALPQSITFGHTANKYHVQFQREAEQLTLFFHPFNNFNTLSKAQQHQLSVEEERYRLIANNTTDFMYEVNQSQHAESGIKWLDGDFKKVTGYSIEEVKANPRLWEQLIHPDDRRRVTEQVVVDIEQKISSTYSYRITTKYGSVRWLEDKVKIRDNGNGNVRILGAVRDITEEKHIRSAFNRERERYMTIFETSRRGILIMDLKKGMTLDLNARAANIFGATRELLIQKNILEHFTTHQHSTKRSSHPMLQDLLLPYLQHREEVKFEWIFSRLDGTSFAAEVLICPIMLNEQPLSAIFIEDLTVRKKNEQQRKISEQRFEWLAESMDGVFSLVDEEGIVYVSNRPKGTWEYCFTQLHTIPAFLRLLHPADRAKVASDLRKIFTEAVNIQYRILLPDKVGTKRERWIWSKTFPLKEYNGKRLVAIISTEITDIKNKEQELVKAKEVALENARLKSDFIASMSHEIRTPMNGIIGFTEMLVDDLIPDQKKKDFPRIINENCEQLLNVLNDILDMSKIEAQQVEVHKSTVDVQTLLKDQVELFQADAKKKNTLLQLENVLPAEQMLVTTDGQKIRQILSNLLSNAIKFTEHGTVILRCSKKGQRLIFTVSDSGIGIAPNQQVYIFERFQQATDISLNTYGGTGLGLSISDGLAQLIEGYIFVSSVPSVGTTFALNLPYEQAIRKDKKPVYSKHPHAQFDFQGCKILVAEDEKFNFILLEKALSLVNVQIVRAETGQEALEQLEQTPDIALILMDMRMPEMDGLQATTIIRSNSRYNRIPIIAQTAFGLREDQERILAAGCDAYISKPIDRTHLYQLLNEHLMSL
ncbi:MAG: PAS domain S-box protein [Bacteroidota bacterium]